MSKRYFFTSLLFALECEAPSSNRLACLGSKLLALLAVAYLSLSVSGAQGVKDEPGWSMFVIGTADACGADQTKVELAASFVAEWAQRNLQDPTKLTKEKALATIKSISSENLATVKEKDAFIYPCSRYREMLDMFNSSKGSVMGGVAATQNNSDDDAQKKGIWTNREGQCFLEVDPESDVVQTVKFIFDAGDKPNEVTLEVGVWMSAKGLAQVRSHNDPNYCLRSYDDIKGTLTVANEKFSSNESGSTGCMNDREHPEKNTIGGESQFLDVLKLKGEQRIKSVLRSILSKDNMEFKLSSGPQSGKIIQIPIRGLKDAIRKLTICPPSAIAAASD